MPVHFLASAVSSTIPTEYWASLAASFIAVSFLKTWSKGAKLLDPPPPSSSQSKATTTTTTTTTPPHPPLSSDALFTDLHGRIVLVASGAFTPLGVVTISALAHRGAQIIALTPDISDPEVIQMIHLIRDSTQSEMVYAEQCDLASLESVSAFAALWNAGDKKQAQGVRRLDSLLFLPPSRYELDRVPLEQHSKSKPNGGGTREAIYLLHVLSRFHLVNSLLSSLLVAPRDREIRIVSVLSPYYSAGLTLFDVLPSSPTSNSTSSTSTIPTLQSLPSQSYTALVGAASLRWHVLTCELQRRLNLLAEADPRPFTKLAGIDIDSSSATLSGFKASKEKKDQAQQAMRQHSNISVINVCPGFETNMDIIETFFPKPKRRFKTTFDLSQSDKDDSKAIDCASFNTNQLFLSIQYSTLVILRLVVLLILFPVIWIFSKSSPTAANSIVWATTRNLEPLSCRYNRTLTCNANESRKSQDPLSPGELYREGRIIRPNLPTRFINNHKQAKQAWIDLWNFEEHQVELRINASGGSIKRPKI
ncbi:uncharacterized protein UTRI_03898 [Ustilago trichophora]|uniref:Ketoreductase (KR) domain-containing protein n=1 Tax=Ustilago trichophora TaxID=86804 RepID=A0A5C3EAT8_9BASI|nr:uncharacterized protein UTRI_03898 [Ustilago trichophora]